MPRPAVSNPSNSVLTTVVPTVVRESAIAAAARKKVTLSTYIRSAITSAVLADLASSAMENGLAREHATV